MGCASSQPDDEDLNDSKHGGHMYVADDVSTTPSPFSARLVRSTTGGHALKDAYNLNGSKSLGKGGYGYVRTCYRKGSRQTVAVKTMNTEMMIPAEVASLEIEIKTLRSLDHPNIVRLFATLNDRQALELHLVMEMLGGGDLHKRLRERGRPYEEALAANYMRSMVSAVRYCHSRGVCHRDIKLENFVFDAVGDNAELKLIDFGLSTRVDGKSNRMKETVGTVAFMAPEVLAADDGAYNEACDVWALGVALYELLAGHMKRPYNTGPVTHSYAKQLKLIRAARPKMPPHISDGAAHLLSALLTRTPQLRLSAAQSLAHPWLDGGERSFVKKPMNMGIEPVALQKALRGFSERLPIERLAFRAVAFATLPQDIKPIAVLFSKLDRDATGSLSREDLKVALRDAAPRLADGEHTTGGAQDAAGEDASSECDDGIDAIYQVLTASDGHGMAEPRLSAGYLDVFDGGGVAYGTFVAAMIAWSQQELEREQAEEQRVLGHRALSSDAVDSGASPVASSAPLLPPIDESTMRHAFELLEAAASEGQVDFRVPSSPQRGLFGGSWRTSRRGSALGGSRRFSSARQRAPTCQGPADDAQVDVALETRPASPRSYLRRFSKEFLTGKKETSREASKESTTGISRTASREASCENLGGVPRPSSLRSGLPELSVKERSERASNERVERASKESESSTRCKEGITPPSTSSTPPAEGQSPSPPASEAVSFEMFRWLLSSGQERALSPRGSMPPSHFFSPSRTSPGNTPCAAGKEPPPRASLAVALTSV